MKCNDTSQYAIKESKEAFRNVKPFRSQIKTFQVNPFITPNSNIYNVAVLTQSEAGCVSCAHYLIKNESLKNFIGNENIFKCSSLCFLSKNKFAYLTTDSKILVSDVSNVNNVVALELSSIESELIDSFHQGPQGKIVLKLSNGIVALYDVNTRKVSNESNEMTDFKFIIWNSSITHVAIIGDKHIFIVNKNLDICHRIKENSNIKSAVFDENSVLFYSTYFQIKYSLINGLSGIIKSTEMAYYLMLVNGGNILYSDCKDGKNSLKFNYTEIRFNIALMNKYYDEIVYILKSGHWT